MKIAQFYKGRYEECGIEFSRIWAMPSPWTFTIHPVQSILRKYVGDGLGWVDPFSGDNSPAEFTNDHNPDRKSKFHLEARDFVKQLKGKYRGILFDPPYSFTQIKQHYQLSGKRPGKEFTDMRFYETVKSLACEKIQKGGHAISFGWNTNGFGKARGFKIIEIMTLAHGGSKNDTLITVEIKI